MILKEEDYRSLKVGLDLDEVKNQSFYVKKLRAVADSNNKNNKEAVKILKVIQEHYPDWLL